MFVCFVIRGIENTLISIREPLEWKKKILKSKFENKWEKKRLKTLKVTEPPKKETGIKVDSVQELISKLHEVEKVI